MWVEQGIRRLKIFGLVQVRLVFRWVKGVCGGK